jgi:hypothetical protein
MEQDATVFGRVLGLFPDIGVHSVESVGEVIPAAIDFATYQ